MFYSTSTEAVAIFLFFVGGVLGLSFFLGRRAKSAAGYYAAHGQVHWFVNGVAFAGDYLSAASFLGICGLIAFYGYDGFLYSIGYLAGWIVALFVIAEPIKRLGKFTFADALDSQFNSRGIKLAAAISTLVVSIFYLIPQMVGAGALVKPLLGLDEWMGVVIVGVTVTLIVTTAGMVSTTWVQFIKGSMLVVFCTILVGMILYRGLAAQPAPAVSPLEEVIAGVPLPAEGNWIGKPYVRFKTDDGHIYTFKTAGIAPPAARTKLLPLYTIAGSGQPGAIVLTECQTLRVVPPTGFFLFRIFQSPAKFANGLPQSATNDIHAVGTIASLPDGKKETGPLGPVSFLTALGDSTVAGAGKEDIKEADGSTTSVFFPKIKKGSDVLLAGGYFPGLLPGKPFTDKLDFISLMLALFCGTASLPHILIRYYTVKDAAAARKSTIVGIAAIGFFYVLTLYLGLGAMTSGSLDPTNNNMSAPLLAKSFSTMFFAIISAIAFTTVLGTVSGLIIAGSGAVAHDLMETFFKIKMDDSAKVRHGKIAAAVLGLGSIGLGILFSEFNVTVLVGWAFNIAASANLPALIMLLFWKRTTAQGITAAIIVGLVSSLGWILLSADTFTKVYKTTAVSPIPFSQPALVTIPLGFLTLVIVSLMTKRKMNVRKDEVGGFPVQAAK